jgi:hypothetical protein
MKTANKIDLKRISWDINGNPRYVCHYTHLLSEADKASNPLVNGIIANTIDALNNRYKIALNKARSLGGKIYRTKKHDGYIVFQSHNVDELKQQIIELASK